MGGCKPLGLLLASFAAAAPAGAQCRLCETPSTIVSGAVDDQGLDLQIESSLNFDRLILSNSGQGSAVIRPDGSNLAQGSIAQVSPRAMVGTAVVRGSPNRAVRVELPRQIDLFSVNGSRLRFDEVVSDLPAAPRLDSTGRLSFRFGGRVTVTGDAEGQFRGDLPINVEYQ